MNFILDFLTGYIVFESHLYLRGKVREYKETRTSDSWKVTPTTTKDPWS